MSIAPYKAILCDLDGCLISGDHVLPGASELIQLAGDALYILSNNSTDTAQTLSTKLSRLGLPVDRERILLAGVCAVDHVAQHYPDTRFMLFGSDALQNYARQLGLLLVEDKANLILITRDTDFSYGKLTRILDQIHEGAALIVANPDLTHPGVNGIPVPETGSLVKWLQACQPDFDYKVIGKPEINLYHEALRRTDVDKSQCLCIGDNKLTDGAGAHRMGMPFAHIEHGDGKQGILDLLNTWGLS